MKKLENVAINDVLRIDLRPSEEMLPLTQNVLGLSDTSDLILMVSFIFAIRRHLIRLASAPFTSYHLAKFRWVPFADPRVRNLAMR